MIVKEIQTPFPYLLVDNFYTSDELPLIWQEIDFLSYPHKFVDGSVSNKEKQRDGVDVKHNKCIYLDNVYADRNISNILVLNRKLFDESIFNIFAKLSFGYDTIKKCNLDYTTLSYYADSDYYLPHDDFSLYTAITWLYKEPRTFEKGNLVFTDYDEEIEIQNNRMILFPSHVVHHVEEIKGDGRYAISQFISRNLVR